MNIKLRYKLVSVVLILTGVFLYGRCSRPGAAAPPDMQSNKPVAVLPQNDKEQIIVDPVKHTLIITGPGNHQTVTTLPDRRTTIDIRKDGTVKVTAPQLGLEAHPYFGLGYSDQTRFLVGADMLYFKKLDLGPMLTFPLHSQADVRVGVKVSYTVWSNLQLAVGYDNRQHINIGVTVRL